MNKSTTRNIKQMKSNVYMKSYLEKDCLSTWPVTKNEFQATTGLFAQTTIYIIPFAMIDSFGRDPGICKEYRTSVLTSVSRAL